MIASGGKVVVDDDAVKARSEGDFELGALEALFDDFGGVGGTADEPLAQGVDAWRLYEDGKGVGVGAFDVERAFDVDVEDGDE